MRTRRGAQPAHPRLAHAHARQPQAVFLVGFMGSGKTSVGKALSRRLGCPFEDLDDRVQKTQGKRIDQIFRDSGESEFRRMETQALRELIEELSSSVQVVALGGGTFVPSGNAALIEAAGVHSVFLDAPVEELLRRCQQEEKNRPLRQTAEQFRALYEARRGSYMKAAFRIETEGKDVNAVAAEVACKLGLG
jgi:shikimate kinase